jgi:DNA-binding winged helix-turn-helix (wHTH) protein
MGEQVRPTYEFGPFQLDAGKRLLLRHGDPVSLAPKVLETLLALIEHRDRVVPKEELLQRVWADTVVEEGGLARNVSILRKALGERPNEHRYVITIPAHGYQFVSDARELSPKGRENVDSSTIPAAASAKPPVARHTARRPMWWSAAAAAVDVDSRIEHRPGTLVGWFADRICIRSSRPGKPRHLAPARRRRPAHSYYLRRGRRSRTRVFA